jgi:eukaryotic-like serine/threonine-protein kinase
VEQLGQYQILGEIARGGMGVVYRARDPGLGREVAIKVVMILGADPATAALRFKREALAAARLRHPNVVGVHGTGRTPNRQPYLVMDLVQGESLGARLRRAGPLSSSEAAALLLDLARAIAYAHDQQVLHRDLKPDNVLLGPGGPVLTDFGLAQILDHDTRLTVSGEVMGTPAYMAPEQANAQPSEVTTDIYGLGATLYAALTGGPPFRTDGLLQTLAAVTGDAPAAIRSLRPEVDPALEAICMRCLEKDPAARYPTAGALVDALAALGSEPAPGGGRRPARVVQGVGAVALLGVGFLAAWSLPRSAEPAGVAEPARVAEPAEPAEPAQPAGPAQAGVSDRPQSARDALARGIDALDRGQTQDALVGFSEALAADPSWAEAYAQRAAAWEQIGREDRAESDMARALELEPRSPLIRALHGWAALQRLQFQTTNGDESGRKDWVQGALDDFERALRADPEQVEALLGRGAVLALGPDPRLAHPDLARVVELDPDSARSLRRAALYQTTAQLVEEPRRLLERARALDPDDPVGWYLEGLLRQRMRDPRGMLEAMTEALERDPRFAKAWHRRSTAQLLIGHVEAAVEDLRRALELTPEDLNVRVALANALVRAGHLREALARYDECLSARPRDVDWLVARAGARRLAGNLEGAVRDLRAAGGLLSPDDVRWPFVANSLAELAGLTEPTPPLVLLEDARRAQREGPQQALRLLERALELQPDWPPALALRARLYQARGEIPLALADAERAVEQQPDDPDLLALRGDLRRSALQVPGAVVDLTRAIELDPAHIEARLALARLRMELQQQPAEAEVLLLEVCRLDPKHARACVYLGTARGLQGDYDSASELHERGLALDPTLPEAWIGRARDRQVAGDHEGAIVALRRARELDPSSMARHELAGLYHNLGRTAEALVEAESVVEDNPSDPRSYMLRGDLLGKAGRHEDAVLDYEAALRLAPPSHLMHRFVVEALARARAAASGQ